MNTQNVEAGKPTKNVGWGSRAFPQESSGLRGAAGPLRKIPIVMSGTKPARKVFGHHSVNSLGHAHRSSTRYSYECFLEPSGNCKVHNYLCHWTRLRAKWFPWQGAHLFLPPFAFAHMRPTAQTQDSTRLPPDPTPTRVS